MSLEGMPDKFLGTWTVLWRKSKRNFGINSCRNLRKNFLLTYFSMIYLKKFLDTFMRKIPIESPKQSLNKPSRLPEVPNQFFEGIAVFFYVEATERIYERIFKGSRV